MLTVPTAARGRSQDYRLGRRILSGAVQKTRGVGNRNSKVTAFPLEERRAIARGLIVGRPRR